MKKNSKKLPGGLGVSPGTAKILRNTLAGAFQFAVDNKFIAENPVSKIKLPPSGQSSATSLTVEEAKAFISVRNHFWFGSAFAFQLHTGLRNQELMALIWDDVDFQNGTLRIERACKWVNGKCVKIGVTKTRRSNRIIELEAVQLSLLQSQLKRQQEVIDECVSSNTEYGDNKIIDWIRKRRSKVTHLYSKTNLIFPLRNGKVPDRHIPSCEFKRMVRSAGIQNSGKAVRWYDLRHTHASILLAAGVPVHEVAERMGHSIIMLLNTYAHGLDNRRRVLSKIMGDLLPI